MVAPTYVQKPSIEKSGTTHSVKSSITTLDEEVGDPEGEQDQR